MHYAWVLLRAHARSGGNQSALSGAFKLLSKNNPFLKF